MWITINIKPQESDPLKELLIKCIVSYVVQASVHESWWWTPICINCGKEIRIPWSIDPRGSQVSLTIELDDVLESCMIASPRENNYIYSLHVHLLCQHDRAGLSLSAYNYDSLYGKKALMMMYRGIMELV